MTKYLLLLAVLTGAASAQTSCPLTPLRKVSAEHDGKCIRTVGIVTFIARKDSGFLVRLSDKKGNSLDIITTEEPYTNELMEAWGTVNASGELQVNSSKVVVIKSQSRRNCNPCV